MRINSIKIILSSVLMLVSGTAVANQTSCEDLAYLAKASMSARQNGVPLTDAIQVVKDDPGAKIIVATAYDEPRFSTEEYIQVAITEYENKVYGLCLKQRSG